MKYRSWLGIHVNGVRLTHHVTLTSMVTYSFLYFSKQCSTGNIMSGKVSKKLLNNFFSEELPSATARFELNYYLLTQGGWWSGNWCGRGGVG